MVHLRLSGRLVGLFGIAEEAVRRTSSCRASDAKSVPEQRCSVRRTRMFRHIFRGDTWHGVTVNHERFDGLSPTFDAIGANPRQVCELDVDALGLGVLVKHRPAG